MHDIETPSPWMVRHAEVGPVASAFWRLTLALPLLILLAASVEIEDGNVRV